MVTHYPHTSPSYHQPFIFSPNLNEPIVMYNCCTVGKMNYLHFIPTFHIKHHLFLVIKMALAAKSVT